VNAAGVALQRLGVRLATRPQNSSCSITRAHSAPKPRKRSFWRNAARVGAEARNSLHSGTSRHAATLRRRRLDQSGGLEVPSSNLGAPIMRRPRNCGAFRFRRERVFRGPFSRDCDPVTKARRRAERRVVRGSRELRSEPELPAEVVPRTTCPGGTSPARRSVRPSPRARIPHAPRACRA
jgi:hypothetical protein